MEQKYLIYNPLVEENTIEKFYNRNNVIFDKNLSLISFLRYKGGSDKTNLDRIFDKYSQFYKDIYRDERINCLYSDLNQINQSAILKLPIFPNTDLWVPKNSFVEELLAIRGKNLFIEETNSTFYFADKFFEMMSNPDYVRVENIVEYGRDISVEMISENVQVWIWSRALSRIINVSPFIQSISTQKSEVGSFNFNLLPIENLQELDSIGVGDFLNFFRINDGSKNKLDFFYKNLQYNDIVFIRFEKLKLEDSMKSRDDLVIDQLELPKQIWDMIGLIDSVSQSSTYSSADYTVSVSGRDLMKLLIEDGSYFLSLRYLNNSESNFVFGFNREGKWFKRNVGDKDGQGGFVSYFFPKGVRTIKDTLGFIVNQLSNIGILPDNQDIFSNYEDKRTQIYKVLENQNNISASSDEANGIWQIIKLLVDSKLDQKVVVDPSIAYVDSTILDQFNKICQKPFVEFLGDTFGNEFDFIVRKPPFDKESILSFFIGSFETNTTQQKEALSNIITLEAKDIEGYNNLEWDQTHYSWYQISPQDAMLGQFSEVMAGGFIPIVYFDELCQYFGNNRLVVTDNYLAANVISASESTVDNDSYRRNLLNDFKYIIDCNSYLPFTRKGQLTLTKGDRRIKKGTFIRVAPMNEIFYVDSISHNLSFSNNKVDRSTTLQVSRGMLQSYLTGAKGYDEKGNVIQKNGKDILFSYFDIIKTTIKKVEVRETVQEETVSPSQQVTSKYTVRVNNPMARIAISHNNPGNMMYNQYQFGSTKGEARINNKGQIVGYWARFDTLEIGFENVMRQIKVDIKKNKSWTIKQFVWKYSPPNENNSQEILDELIRNLNGNSTMFVKESTPIVQIDTYELAKFVIKRESSSSVQKLDSTKIVENVIPKETSTVTKTRFEDKYSFDLIPEQLEFFMKRQQFNLSKNESKS